MTAPRIPLHERIRADLEASILSGELAPGERIPFEHELTDRYGCARMTVSKAVSALVAAGLVERRKRAGSFVTRPRIHSMILDIPDLGAEIERRGERYGFELLERAVRAPLPGRETELSREGPVLALDGIHLADDRPFAVEHRLINLAAVPQAATADFTVQPPGSWLLSHIPWTEAETHIDALNIADPVAARLRLPAGTACLEIRRRTWRGALGVTLVRQTFAPGSYELVARFGPAR